jgi:hypothetical protein
MADEQLLSKVHSLSDLELAFLLSLIAREHCQVRTPSTSIPDLVAELRLVSTKIFHLQPAVISCTTQTTLDEFASALLLANPSSSCTNSPVSNSTFRSPSPLATRSPRQRPHHSHDGPSSYFGQSGSAPPISNPNIAPVIIAANLDTAPRAVQIQALELLRTRRVFTRTSVHIAPKTFLFVAIVSSDRQGPGLNRWLNEWFYLAHSHSLEDGYPNLEEEEDDEGHRVGLGIDGLLDGDNHGARTDRSSYAGYGRGDDAASTASSESVLVRTPRPRPQSTADPTGQRSNGKLPATHDGFDEPHITESDISFLAQLSQQVQVDVDVARYQMNIVSFLRMHRAVAGGISPMATKHVEQLAKSLAPLHGLDYVTPSLVQLAVRKVYLHRIQIVAPERERSVQWGSELAAVEAILEGVGPEDVIEDVLDMVTVPL